VDAVVIAQYVLSGVVIGLIYSLMALGITFIYGIMKMINWAMGEFYMLGSYVQYALIASLLGPRRWWLALPVTMARCSCSGSSSSGCCCARCSWASSNGATNTRPS